MKDHIEYQVQSVTRYVVTRLTHGAHEGSRSVGIEQMGEFQTKELASRVAESLCSADPDGPAKFLSPGDASEVMATGVLLSAG